MYTENNHTVYADQYEYDEETATRGEKAAVALVAAYTLFTLVVSAWSGLILASGADSNGGPLGYLMQFILHTVVEGPGQNLVNF